MGASATLLHPLKEEAEESDVVSDLFLLFLLYPVSILKYLFPC
jgi:hypothetical protein